MALIEVCESLARRPIDPINALKLRSTYWTTGRPLWLKDGDPKRAWVKWVISVKQFALWVRMVVSVCRRTELDVAGPSSSSLSTAAPTLGRTTGVVDLLSYAFLGARFAQSKTSGRRKGRLHCTSLYVVQ